VDRYNAVNIGGEWKSLGAGGELEKTYWKIARKGDVQAACFLRCRGRSLDAGLFCPHNRQGETKPTPANSMPSHPKAENDPE